MISTTNLLAKLRTVSKQCMKDAAIEDIPIPWDDDAETAFTKLLPLYGCVNERARFHRPDLWHAVHLGVGKSFLSSSMSVIQKAIPGNNVDACFRQVTEDYRAFCKARHLTPFVTKLDAYTFGVGGPMEEPSGGWNKASLTSTISEFLEHFLTLYPEELENLNDVRVPYIETWLWQVYSSYVFCWKVRFLCVMLCCFWICCWLKWLRYQQ